MQLYAYQKEIADAVRSGKNIILQAPTGAGKTMAALWPFLQNWEAAESELPRKLIYSVPMRVLANQFYKEYKHLLQLMRITNEPKISLQTGEYREDPSFEKDMIFATIDQVLSSWLMHPYSLSGRKGNINAGALVGSYLVFDEFHLFAPDSTLPTTLQMLKTLKKVSPFILMTATFSQLMLEKLAVYLDAEPFLLTEEMLTEIPAQQKERRFYTMPQPLTEKDEQKVVHVNPTAVGHILQTHLQQTQAKPRTLVVCNQVERAQTLYSALCQQKPEEVTVCLLHGRFLKEDRQAIEALITREFGKDKGKQTVPSLIVVATQVVEVGLDMSCAVLHTELAPGAAVLQRAGRCARYAGEVGTVYVYPLAEGEYGPYKEGYAKEQCDLAWEWLQNNQDRHLDFMDEQALINHAHGRSDEKIIEGVFGSEFERSTQIRSVWRGEKDRGEASRLVRNIQNVSIAVHADPELVKQVPFRVDTFSLHPGTLKGKFEQWKKQNDALDPEFDEGHLEWLVCKLVEEEADGAAQGNQPIEYGFKRVSSQYELNAPLLLVNPALVGYSKELGLTLYPSVPYETAVPPTAVAREFVAYNYKLESYYRHIELVHQAFVEQSLPQFRRAAARLERAYGWQEGIVLAMAHVVMLVHDVGKLSTGWQGWAQEWQATIGLPVPQKGYAAAHTDYDRSDPQHRLADRKLYSKRPSHAIEGAFASFRLLNKVVQSNVKFYQPLVRAAFTAVARHHAAFSSQAKAFKLVPEHMEYIESTWELLPAGLRPLMQGGTAVAEVEEKDLSRITNQMFIDPNNDEEVCCYMLLVRALRMADQEGTSRGSE